MLTNRELATVILVAAFLGWAFTRKDVRGSMASVVRAVFRAKIVVPVLVFLAYAAAVVALAFRLHGWEWGTFKDTIVTMLVVGFPMFGRAVGAKDYAVFSRRVVKETIGVGALALFYVNLASMNLFVELGLQLLIAFSVCMSVVAKNQEAPASKHVGRFFDVVTILASLGMFTYTTVWLVRNWQSLDLRDLGLTFAMSIWLPLALIPFFYLLTLYAATEMLFVMLPFANERQQPHWKVRLGLLLGLRGSVRLTANFNGHWRWDVAGLTSSAAVRQTMQEYRASMRESLAHRRRRFAREI